MARHTTRNRTLVQRLSHPPGIAQILNRTEVLKKKLQAREFKSCEQCPCPLAPYESDSALRNQNLFKSATALTRLHSRAGYLRPIGFLCRLD